MHHVITCARKGGDAIVVGEAKKMMSLTAVTRVHMDAALVRLNAKNSPKKTSDRVQSAHSYDDNRK